MDANLLVSAIIGGALTLAVQYVLERFRHDRADQKEDRAFRRSWHTELVDLVADAQLAVEDLDLLLETGSGSSRMTLDDFLAQRWDGQTGLRRRLDRVMIGHPDGLVRQAAMEVVGAITVMINTLLRIALRTDTPDVALLKDGHRELLHSAPQRAIHELISCIDGGDVVRPDLQSARAFRVYDEHVKPHLPRDESSR